MPKFFESNVKVLKETNPERFYKVFELAQNALHIFQSFFTNEIGGKFISTYLAEFKAFPTVFSWGNYDSIFHLSHGLEFSISRGYDYEDGLLLNRNMRQVRFTGWTGKISFE